MFSQINPFFPDVVVKKFPRWHKPLYELVNYSKVNENTLRGSLAKEYRKKWREFLKDNSAEIGVDLHDDIPALKLPDYRPQKGYHYIPRAATLFHFSHSETNDQNNLYEQRMKVKIGKFETEWNKQNEASTLVSSCDCYTIYRRGCNLPLVEIEFHNLDGKLSITNGVKYVGALVRYLLSNF